MARLFAFVLAGLLGSLTTPRAQSVPLEYQVKAAYLYHFTQFIEWPPDAASGPLTICLARRNPFGTTLQDLVANERAGTRPLTVQVITDPDPSCRVLFIPSGVAPGAFVRALRETPTLTVGETERFLDQGGVANFYRDGRNVRFEINREAAEKARLRISARLLQLARLPAGGRG